MENGTEDVNSKVNKGFFWLFFSGIFSSAVLFFLNIFIVRILDPAAFGIMALCTTIITVLTVISSFGIGDALINKNTNAERADSTAFSLLTIIYAIVSVAILAITPAIASFFNEQRLAIALPVIVIGFWIRGIATVPATLLAKEMAFKKLSMLELASNIANPVIVIASFFALPKDLAFLSLPIGYALSSLLYSILVIKYSKKIKWGLHSKEAKELASFGYKIAVVSMLAVLLVYGANFFVGKIFGITKLGIFTIAFGITSIPIELISSSFYRTSYAGFSRIKNDKKKATALFDAISNKTILIAFPILAWFFIFSEPFSTIVLKKDIVLGQLIAMFCIYSFFRALQKNYTSLFAGLGKPGLNIKISIVEIAVLLPAIALLISPFGMHGIVLALVLGKLSSVISAVFISHNILADSKASVKKSSMLSVALAVIPAIFVLTISFLGNSTAWFLTGSAIFFCLYAVQYYFSGFFKQIRN